MFECFHIIAFGFHSSSIVYALISRSCSSSSPLPSPSSTKNINSFDEIFLDSYSSISLAWHKVYFRWNKKRKKREENSISFWGERLVFIVDFPWFGGRNRTHTQPHTMNIDAIRGMYTTPSILRRYCMLTDVWAEQRFIIWNKSLFAFHVSFFT